MRLTPQKYVTSTLAEAVAAGCDIVQPKVRGRWVRLEVIRGTAHVFDPIGESPFSFDVRDKTHHCVLIGDLVADRHVIVWDCWRIGEDGDELSPMWTDLTPFGYRDRFGLLKKSVEAIGIPVGVALNYPITQAQTLWNYIDAAACGLVFRRSADPVDVPLRVARKYKELPMALE